MKLIISKGFLVIKLTEKLINNIKTKIDEKYIATSLYFNFIEMNVIFLLINLNKIIFGN